jgi:uncharacterized phiE125 gp8 family phage protein
MNKVLITPATFDPITVEEIKARPEIRIDASNHDDDPNLAQMLKSAIEAYQNFTGRVLCSSTWDLYLDAFPDEIELPAPLVSVTSIGYYDANNALQTPLATTYYKVSTRNPIFGLITLKYGQTWPDTYPERDVVIVRFVSGYASAEDIPQTIKDGLLAKVQELYDGIDRTIIYEGCWINEARLAI